MSSHFSFFNKMEFLHQYNICAFVASSLMHSSHFCLSMLNKVVMSVVAHDKYNPASSHKKITENILEENSLRIQLNDFDLRGTEQMFNLLKNIIVFEDSY